MRCNFNVKFQAGSLEISLIELDKFQMLVSGARWWSFQLAFVDLKIRFKAALGSFGLHVPVSSQRTAACSIVNEVGQRVAPMKNELVSGFPSPNLVPAALAVHALCRSPPAPQPGAALPELDPGARVFAAGQRARHVAGDNAAGFCPATEFRQ